MILNPDVQAKGQKEIDDLLKGTRLPEVEDQDSLPYICSILKEVFRWRSVVPLGNKAPILRLRKWCSNWFMFAGVPHACIQEDEYKGYRIPKGSVV